MFKRILLLSLSLTLASMLIACGSDSGSGGGNNNNTYIPPFYPNNPNNNGQWKTTWAQYGLGFSSGEYGGRLLFYSPTQAGGICLMDGKYAYGYQYYVGASDCENYTDYANLYLQMNTKNQMRIVVEAYSTSYGKLVYSSPTVNIDDSYNNSQGLKLTIGPTWNNTVAPYDLWDEHGIVTVPVASPTATSMDVTVSWGKPGSETPVLQATLNKL